LQPGKVFFSEEKNQKTFVSSPASRPRHSLHLDAAAGIKVFLLLFLQKKKSLPGFFMTGTFRAS
jgi:hypothetical protein